MQGDQTSVPLPVVAAIIAALSVVLDKPVGSFTVKSITPEPQAPAPSVWAKAGLIESHLSRRQFGFRSR